MFFQNSLSTVLKKKKEEEEKPESSVIVSVLFNFEWMSFSFLDNVDIVHRLHVEPCRYNIVFEIEIACVALC